ncbi:hypothetical protein DH2020_008202 [Rehmannia glutinosa]|uniref:Uncharacterized protein n=1 Tax=Rehmannia glutinosa TaxID=99300 RepID=A0ABR0U0C3_REHGL
MDFTSQALFTVQEAPGREIMLAECIKKPWGYSATSTTSVDLPRSTAGNSLPRHSEIQIPNHLRSVQHNRLLDRRRCMQIQGILLRDPTGQQIGHRRRLHRFQRLPIIFAVDRRIPRSAPRYRPLPRQFQQFLRFDPAKHRRSPLFIRARHQQQQILRSLSDLHFRHGRLVLSRHTLQFLLRRGPPELFTRNIDALFLNNNNFMTRLPESIGATNILYLTLANNKFFGPIPRGIAEALSGLSEILLLNNFLSGCLPYELGLLKDAVVFDAGNNNLTGPLPFSLGCLENLEVLNFAGNMLYGNIPEILCGLGKLANLSLSDNYFTQVGPICRGLIQNGVLDVRKNCIPGQPFQRSMAECAGFFARTRYCPYMDTYSQVPCWVPHSNSSELAPELAPSS